MRLKPKRAYIIVPALALLVFWWFYQNSKQEWVEKEKRLSTNIDRGM